MPLVVTMHECSSGEFLRVRTQSEFLCYSYTIIVSTIVNIIMVSLGVDYIRRLASHSVDYSNVLTVPPFVNFPEIPVSNILKHTYFNRGFLWYH